MTTSEPIASDKPNLPPATADAWAVVYLDVSAQPGEPEEQTLSEKRCPGLKEHTAERRVILDPVRTTGEADRRRS